MKTIGVGIEGVGVFKVALMGLLCLLCEVTRLAGRAPNRGAGKNPMYLSSSTKDKTIQYTRLNHSLSNACVERGNCQSVEGGRRSATETQEFGRALAIRSNLISVLADWPPPGLVELSTRRSEEKKKRHRLLFSPCARLQHHQTSPCLGDEPVKNDPVPYLHIALLFFSCWIVLRVVCHPS